MTTAMTLSPLFRRTVGFDRFNDLFESAFRDEQVESYPPYNIEKLGADNYRITMAVAGFGIEDLNITAQGNELKVSGRHTKKEDASGVEYLHRGIATRAFERTFQLADHVKVVSAEMENGLLNIALVHEVPEAAKPRMIEIRGANADTKKVTKN